MRTIEDGTDEVTSGLSSEVIAEGTSLVEQFLSDWASRSSHPESGGDDADMTGQDGETDRLLEGELESLKEVYEEWKDRMEASQWVREVLSKTA